MTIIKVINFQHPEKQSDAETIEYVNIWHTIQGEGPFAGKPALFVRLAGCNLHCRLCDSDYTTDRKEVTPEELVRFIRKELRTTNTYLIVFTGGEPFRQKSLSTVLSLLNLNNHIIQIETNGTLFFETPIPVVLVCSPKTRKINNELRNSMAWSDSYKYVVEAGHVDQDDGLPTRVLGEDCYVARPPHWFPKDRIYVQPADEQDDAKNMANMQQAVRVCMEHGYRLCLQMQKIVGLE